MKNESQIKIKIVEIIQQNLNLPEDREISDSTPLADIISNSVEFIQIIVDIEDEFAVEFKNDELGFQYFPYIGDLIMKTRRKIDNTYRGDNDGTDSI